MSSARCAASFSTCRHRRPFSTLGATSRSRSAPARANYSNPLAPIVRHGGAVFTSLSLTPSRCNLVSGRPLSRRPFLPLAALRYDHHPLAPKSAPSRIKRVSGTPPDLKSGDRVHVLEVL